MELGHTLLPTIMAVGFGGVFSFVGSHDGVIFF